MGSFSKILFQGISLDHHLYQMTPKVTTLTLFKNGLESLVFVLCINHTKTTALASISSFKRCVT